MRTTIELDDIPLDTHEDLEQLARTRLGLGQIAAGYGPEVILSAIETGKLDDIHPGRVRTLFNQSISAHFELEAEEYKNYAEL